MRLLYELIELHVVVISTQEHVRNTDNNCYTAKYSGRYIISLSNPMTIFNDFFPSNLCGFLPVTGYLFSSTRRFRGCMKYYELCDIYYAKHDTIIKYCSIYYVCNIPKAG